MNGGRSKIKPLFSYGQVTNLRLVVLVIASVVLMTLDHRHNHMETMRGWVSVVVYPLQYLVDLPISASTWLGENMVTRDHLLAENSRLQSQQTVLKVQLQKMISLELENMRLRKLLDSSYHVGERILVAELLAVDLDPFTRRSLINKGGVNNVYVGQPILDADGVFGQVMHVTPYTATAMLITDPSHALPVQVARNGLRAIAAGTGNDDRLELLHIPNNADIAAGDLLTTSGLDQTFPKGYPVATVISVEPDTTQPYATVSAQPVAKLDRTREVLLVWSEDGTGKVTTTAPSTPPAQPTETGAKP